MFTYIDGGDGELLPAGVLEQSADVITEDDTLGAVQLGKLRHGEVRIRPLI